MKSWLLVFALLGLTSHTTVGVAQGQPDADDLKKQRAMAFVASLETGTAEAVAQFFTDHLAASMYERRGADEWQTIAKRLSGDLGGAELLGITVGGPTSMALRLSAPPPRKPPVMVELEFEEASPFKITGLGIEVGGPAEDEPELPALELAPGIDSEDLAGILEAYVADLARHDRFSGTVLLAHRGEVLFRAAHGQAHRRYNVPVTLETRFDLGSINKKFTKVAIGQLLEQGKLALEDRIIDHLPEYPNADVAKRVTVEQLVEHTSGLGDIFTDRYFNSSRAQYRSPRDYFALFADQSLQFEPGEGRSYSNAGYIVLGAIVEAVSGQPYAAYIRDHVFAPAGMAKTGFLRRDGVEPDVAEGYTRWAQDGPGELHSNVYHLPVVGSPAGSAYSTVEDLYRFDSALREDRLLSPQYTAWIFESDQRNAAGRAAHPMGIAGGGPGVSAVLESDGETALIVLANLDPPIAESLARQLWKPLKGVLQ